MTSSRMGRVSKGRVFIYVVCGLFLVALIACYKNASTLLEEALQSYERCRQEQENTSQQLHVVFDYKQRLEKTLQSEKAEHVHAKTDFSNKLNEEKLKCEKIINDVKLKFSTLQQHYNLLQTQLDDYKEEGSKVQREQMGTINQLQAKLKEVQEEVKRTVSDKEKSIQLIQAQKNALEQENAALKEKIAALLNNKQAPVVRTEYSSTQFNQILPVGNAQYVIAQDNNNEQNQNAAVLPIPSQEKSFKNNNNVYTPKTSPKALNAALPLNAPSATPETSKSSTTRKSLPLPLPYQQGQAQIPDGVVPAPNLNIGADESKQKENTNYDKESFKAGEDVDARFKNVGAKPDIKSAENKEKDTERKDNLKNQFNVIGDNEDAANEDLELPNHNEKDPHEKRHDDTGINPDHDQDYDPHNFIDPEEDDFGDGDKPEIHLDQAERN